MDWTALSNDIYEATKKAFISLKASFPSEDFYAYALYTDSGAMTVVPAANSLQGLQCKLNEDSDPSLKPYYQWASAEWKYEAWKADEFVDICKTLRESPERVSFNAFQIDLFKSMTFALKRLSNEGFFGEGAEREKVTLFITISDDDCAEQVENESAKTLNPLNAARLFLARFDNDAIK